MVRAALMAFLMSSLGCSSSEASDSPKDAGNGDGALGCKPTTIGICQGPNNCAGSRLCMAQGTWSPCDCGWTGGSGGTGGTGGSGGGAGSSSGGTTGGGGSPPTALDPHECTFHDNPANVADWTESTTITALAFQYNGEDGVHVEFSKRDGPDRWPDVTPPGWDEPLQYTMGMAELIGGKWHCSAAIQFWYGLEASGGNVALDNQVAVNWYYDGRWGEMNGYQPTTGETIGIFVVAGNLRGVLDGSQSPVQERSNIVLVPMPDVSGAQHTF